jgi:pyrroloquinoline-quinone synthase
MFVKQLQEELDHYSLLKHDFYKRWSCGQLKMEELQHYGAQYYHHVDAFPRYISTIHSNCPSKQARQILLGNLIEEEQGDENHPELWLRFTDCLGVKRAIVKQAALNDETKNLVDGFFKLCRSSYAEGVAALYTYEQQVPKVAQSKIEGLKKYYGIESENGLKFFNVHISADEWHSEECAQLLEQLPAEDKPKARNAALKAAQLLLGFLDGVDCHSEERKGVANQS